VHAKGDAGRARRLAGTLCPRGLARFASIRLDPPGLVDMVTNPHMVE
jgi:hypothetical protein